MTELENYIHTFFGVKQNDVSKIVTFFKPVQLKKGDFFLKTGMSANKLAFVQSGMLREFVEIEGKEITKWITSKGYFVVDLGSFVFGQSARWNIQALTDCELYLIDFIDYQKIGQAIPKWLELEKMFITKCFSILEERVLQHLSMSAEDRYRQLFQSNKELFNTVPLPIL